MHEIQQELFLKALAVQQSFQSLVQTLSCGECGSKSTQIQLGSCKPMCYLCGARFGEGSGLPLGSLSIRVEEVVKAVKQSRFQKAIAEVRGMIRERIKKLQEIQTSLVDSILTGASFPKVDVLLGRLVQARARALLQSGNPAVWLPQLTGLLLRVRELIVQSSEDRTTEIQVMKAKLDETLKRVDAAFAEKPVLKIERLKRVTLEFKGKPDKPIFIKGSSWIQVLRQLRKTNLVEYQFVTLCCTCVS